MINPNVPGNKQLKTSGSEVQESEGERIYINNTTVLVVGPQQCESLQTKCGKSSNNRPWEKHPSAYTLEPQRKQHLRRGRRGAKAILKWNCSERWAENQEVWYAVTLNVWLNGRSKEQVFRGAGI